MSDFSQIVKSLSDEMPVLIAGPTASGKSALAMEIAARGDSVIINADALQVFADWRVLTARPSLRDEASLPHALYGHVPGHQAYSVGHWLRAVAPLLAGKRPVIVGGTGLYFAALTEGLAEIPEIPPEVRAEGAGLSTDDKRAALDPATAAQIDLENPVRVTRAWEVQAATGKGMAAWQAETPPPLLPLSKAQPLVVNAPKDWLTPRITQRFEAMLVGGALEEARANAPGWSPDCPSAKAIGARELIAHVNGEMSLAAVQEAAVTATRQYAKRQRTWFRARMRQWRVLSAA